MRMGWFTSAETHRRVRVCCDANLPALAAAADGSLRWRSGSPAFMDSFGSWQDFVLCALMKHIESERNYIAFLSSGRVALNKMREVMPRFGPPMRCMSRFHHRLSHFILGSILPAALSRWVEAISIHIRRHLELLIQQRHSLSEE